MYQDPMAAKIKKKSSSMGETAFLDEKLFEFRLK